MPDRQLTWVQVRDVLIKRRKAGQAPHWAMGWVAARVAKSEDATVNAAYKTTVLDYYDTNATSDEDAIKMRTWHRLIGFVDGLHNAGLGDASSGAPTTAPEDDVVHDDDKTLLMDPPL